MALLSDSARVDDGWDPESDRRKCFVPSIYIYFVIPFFFPFLLPPLRPPRYLLALPTAGPTFVEIILSVDNTAINLN
jgi:hypothetical protein